MYAEEWYCSRSASFAGTGSTILAADLSKQKCYCSKEKKKKDNYLRSGNKL
jgi:hypothetical protein